MAIDKTITKILNKLFEKGYVSEKAIMSLSLEDICKIECYAPAEIEAPGWLRFFKCDCNFN